VLITGGGTGIGAAIAERFVADGARVAILGRRQAPLDEVAERTGALAVVADVSDAEQTRRAIATVIEAFGRIDVVVANAGGHGFGTLEQTTDDDWAASLSANLTSAFVIARETIASLVETRGQLVIVSSLAGLAAGPSTAGYTTTKHALIGLMRSIARDYGPQGVRANAICPGWVRTPMADQEMDEFAEAAGVTDRAEAYRIVTAEVPLRRPAEPHEIASVAAFLGSAQSSYVSGSVIVVDGGSNSVDVPTLAFERAGL
jgi:NAD(P)-dependent dehydrogenase (short-subunit alcohol dehydrogenase family)